MTDNPPVKIRVIYKSGATVDLTCDSFTIRRREGELIEVKWENPNPSPLFFGVDHVAAVWEILPDPDDIVGPAIASTDA